MVVIAALTGVLGWWAGRATVGSGSSASEPSADVLATVQSVEVGDSLTLNVTVDQPYAVVASNLLSGVVTASHAGRIAVGSEVYAVAGVGVRAVVGTMPFYRSLSLSDQGADVRQVQEAMRSLGYLTDAADGEYDAATVAAVSRWQRATAQSDTDGSIARGALVAVPRLPARLRLDDAVRTGAVVAGGEPAVLAPAAAPRFALVVSQEQAAEIPPDAVVKVHPGRSGDTWRAVVDGTEEREGAVRLRLAAPDGGPVCGARCGMLPAEETASLRADVEVVPERTGPGVPSAAIWTDPAGDTYVTSASGEEIPVRVLASSDGLAVVDGVRLGDRVRLFSGPDPSAAATP